MSLQRHFLDTFNCVSTRESGCLLAGWPVARTIAKRVSRFLEKEGYLVRDAESEYLDLLPDEDDAMSAIVGASITDRLVFGPNYSEFKSIE